EPYGPETYITLRLGELQAIGRLSPDDNPVKGERFGLTTRLESLFFFDPATNAAIR
ncbi:MAG: hypothetical protein JRH11_21925, partial [Deltaproteobacteria bacterium]|nr:hypothetical protein [Deltaproteobacteria bacterium]